MALVCVYNCYRSVRTVINSEHVCKITCNNDNTYSVQLSSDDFVDVNQHDLRNIIKALGYDENGIDFYVNYLEG